MATAGRRWVRWSPNIKAKFFDHLAGTCNVKASAEAAGVNPISVYALRRKDPAFAEEWHGALLAGYEILETAVVGYALSGGDGEAKVECAGGAVDIDVALRLLSAHRNALAGKWRGGPRLHRATREETDKAILKKLAALKQAEAETDAGASAGG